MHINQPGGAGAFCPNCRQKKAYDSELVVQPVLEAASNHWRHTRSFLMKQWQKMQELESKRSEMKGAEANGEPHETLARSRKRVRGTPDEDQDYRALDAGTIVQCPICQREFDAIAINAHLDRGCGTEDPGPPTMDHWLRASSPVTHSTEKRLTRPQYQLKTERDMRKLLEVRTNHY